MGGGENATKGVDIIKLMTGSSTRTRNSTCVGKKYIQRLIAQIIKNRKTMRTREQVLPVVYQS